jgi:hypothetical protein
MIVLISVKRQYSEGITDRSNVPDLIARVNLRAEKYVSETSFWLAIASGNYTPSSGEYGSWCGYEPSPG